MVKSFNGFRVMAVASVVCSAFLLVACGGGGGGSTTVATPVIPAPAPVVNAPVLTLASMSPLPVASPLLVTSDKVLEGVTQVLVMTPQSTTLAGNAALAADKKSVTITMASSLPYATVITITVKAKANGVEGSVTGTVTTESAPVAVVCPVPSVKHLTMNACIYPKGIQKVAPGNELAPSVTKVTDAGFLTAMGNGDVLLFDTDIKMENTNFSVADRTRTLVYASYRQNGKYFLKPLFKDTLTGTVLHDDNLTASVLSGFVYDRIQSMSAGVYFRQQPGNECLVSIWDNSAIGFVGQVSTTCPAWN